MFKRIGIDTRINNQTIRLLEEMAEDKTDSPEFAKRVDQLIKLHTIRDKNRISHETWATIGANLAGIALILGHERASIIATKSLGLVKKIF